jgi:2-amino-4-hydroxy-6-hydroxymethyldihydropteridine diphosphokinase
MTRAFLGLGSNVGDRQAHLGHAVSRLARATSVTGVSAVYETEPVGLRDQPRFLNMVVRLETELGPGELLQLARAIEAERGRARTVRNGPRTLDIDLLLYGDQRVRREGLTVPHPRMRDRAFVLVPLLELEPELTEPGTGRRYAELLETAGSGGVVRRMPGEELSVRLARAAGPE